MASNPDKRVKALHLLTKARGPLVEVARAGRALVGAPGRTLRDLADLAHGLLQFADPGALLLGGLRDRAHQRVDLAALLDHLAEAAGDLGADLDAPVALRDGVLDAVGRRAGRLGAALGKAPDFIGHDSETRPASPARAASTAALRARMFVWNAISSIVLMILEMLVLEVLISSIARVICTMSAALVSAAERVCAARTFVFPASTAFWFEAFAISSSDALVSSSEAACRLAPSDRSALVDEKPSALPKMSSARFDSESDRSFRRRLTLPESHCTVHTDKEREGRRWWRSGRASSEDSG